MSEQAKSNTLIMLCCLNVNQSNAATHAAMYIIVESKDPGGKRLTMNIEESHSQDGKQSSQSTPYKPQNAPG